MKILYIFFLLFFTSCSEERPSVEVAPKPQKEKIQIIDGNGEKITVHRPAERIIVEYVDNAELVRLLNRKDRIVGVAGYDYIFEKCPMQFPELSKKPSIGLFWKLDYEAVFSLQPDLLLTFGPNTEDKRNKLPGIDVVFLGLYYPDLIDTENSRFIRGIKNLGLLLNAEQEAEDYIAWYLGLIDLIRSRTANLAEHKKPRIFITSFPHADINIRTYSAYSEKDTLTQAAVLAGGKIISEELPEFSQARTGITVDMEWLLLKDPDIIIMHAVDRVDMYGYETDDITGLDRELQRFMARPELASLKAIQTQQVYVFDGHFRNDASGGISGAAYMAKIFHPDLFLDLNPKAIHQEYITKQGLDYNLDEHGIFVYPPIVSEETLMGIPERYRGQIF